MSNTDRLSMLERWADGMEKLEQYYEGIYGPPATPAQLPPITTYDAMLEAIADGMERAKRNINKKSTTYHSDSVAYVKTVPSGDVHYASIEQIGGKTLVWNQLNDNIQYSQTVNGITFTKNADESWTINGTATADGNINIGAVALTTHRFFLFGCPSGGSAETYGLGLRGTYSSTIYTLDYGNGGMGVWGGNNPGGRLAFRFHSGDNFNNVTVFFKVFDATLMFGAGNEPTTVEEFTAIFPMDSTTDIPYNAGTLLSAGVTEVVSKKADTTEIATYSIPAEVRALSGYGWSCPDHYNYIDYEAKKYVQEVGSRAYASGDESDATVITDGTTTYYPLNPAVETDISQYLTDDNLISVESGGTLTFPNSNGDDYRIPVPSSETFIVGEP